MVVQALAAIQTVIAQCISWWEQIMDQTGGISVYMGSIVLCLVFKYLLSPIYGRLGSDTAQGYLSSKFKKKG